MYRKEVSFGGVRVRSLKFAPKKMVNITNRKVQIFRFYFAQKQLIQWLSMKCASIVVWLFSFFSVSVWGKVQIVSIEICARAYPNSATTTTIFIERAKHCNGNQYVVCCFFFLVPAKCNTQQKWMHVETSSFDSLVEWFVVIFLSFLWFSTCMFLVLVLVLVLLLLFTSFFTFNNSPQKPHDQKKSHSPLCTLSHKLAFDDNNENYP